MNQANAGSPTLTIAQISDVHLKSPAIGYDPTRTERFRHVVELAMTHHPDRLILTGDLTEDGFDDIRELQMGKAALQAEGVGMPLLIPGNHDIGDKPGTGPNAINQDRLDNWLTVFGSDRFMEDIAHWRLIGLDSLLINSGLPREAEQLAWLDQTLADARKLDQRVALFMHEPPFLGKPGMTFGNRSDYWAIAPEKQREYLQRLGHPSVRLVATGHVHWHHHFMLGNVLHVWCPSPAFIVDDPNFPRGGGISGILLFKLHQDHATFELLPYIRSDTQVVQLNGA